MEGAVYVDSALSAQFCYKPKLQTEGGKQGRKGAGEEKEWIDNLSNMDGSQVHYA